MNVRLHVGISDWLPKLIAYRLLQPALALPEPVHLAGVYWEGPKQKRKGLF